jgi:hypothetical protein
MIFRIDPDQITTRCEMGQRLSAEKKAQLVKQLETRGSETDLLTAAEIRKQINLEN